MNKEIIIKETNNLLYEKLDTIISYYGDNEIDFCSYERQCNEQIKQFATNLLPKLQALDRDNVREIIRTELYESEDMERREEEIVDQICQLIPEQGEVIAEGIVKYDLQKYFVYIGHKELTEISEFLSEKLEDFKDEKIHLIIRKCKEEK